MTHRRRRNRRSTARSAFTLLELLLVLAILVVLGGIVIVNVGGVNADANAKATLVQLRGLKQNVEMYRLRTNVLPENLEALRDGPSDAAQKSSWSGPIIDTIPKDAWGKDFVYSVNGNNFEISSGGIDGQSNTDDDIKVAG